MERANGGAEAPSGKEQRDHFPTRRMGNGDPISWLDAGRAEARRKAVGSLVELGEGRRSPLGKHSRLMRRIARGFLQGADAIKHNFSSWMGGWEEGSQER